jgi:hypothetical protein
MILTTKKVATAKRVARPPIKPPHPDPDPLGFFPALHAKLEEAYDAQLLAFLRRNLLVSGLTPSVRQSIFAAVKARGQAVSVDFRITFYPADASGFFRADGELMTPVAELAAEPQPAEPRPDDPEYGPWIKGIFGGELVRARRPKGGWRNRGRAG